MQVLFFGFKRPKQGESCIKSFRYPSSENLVIHLNDIPFDDFLNSYRMFTREFIKYFREKLYFNQRHKNSADGFYSSCLTIITIVRTIRSKDRRFLCGLSHNLRKFEIQKLRSLKELSCKAAGAVEMRMPERLSSKWSKGLMKMSIKTTLHSKGLWLEEIDL